MALRGAANADHRAQPCSRGETPRRTLFLCAPTRPERTPTLATVEFSKELRPAVLAGDITVSVRLWQHAKVSVGKRYAVGPGEIEIDAIELVPFDAITATDVRRSGEADRESMRRRAAHAGPIDDTTLVYRVEFHTISAR